MQSQVSSQLEQSLRQIAGQPPALRPAPRLRPDESLKSLGVRPRDAERERDEHIDTK